MKAMRTVVFFIFVCIESSELMNIHSANSEYVTDTAQSSSDISVSSDELIDSDNGYVTSSYRIKNVNDMWNHLVNYFRDNPTTENFIKNNEMQNDGVFVGDNFIKSDSEIKQHEINLNSLDGLSDEQIWNRLTETKLASSGDGEMLSDENNLRNEKSITKVEGLKSSSFVSGYNSEEKVKTTCLECNEHRTSDETRSLPVKDLDEDYLNDLLDEKYQSDSPVTGPGDAKGSATLAFVFDSTGSMWDDLVQVKQGATKIMATMLERPDKPIADYVLVPFHDPVIGPATVTTDHALLMQRLNEINVYGGGDCPEMTVGAVEQALRLSRPNSYIYVFTDARSKDYHLLNQVLALIQRKQSQVVFVMTGDCGDQTHPGYLVFQKIAATSSGQVYHLNKTDVKEVLTFVRVSLQSRKVNLLSVDRPITNQNENLPLPIDKTIKEFTVSVSGSNASIGVVDPGGRPAVPPQVTPLLDLQNVKVVNVKEPNPGQWNIQVHSDSQHTVRCTGLSGSDFVFGFSVVPTFHMSETNHRPLKGAQNNVLVSATEPENIFNFTSLELIGIDGKLKEVIELIPVPGKPGLYSGGPFIPPEEIFNLGVNGFGRDKFPMKRITPTAISSQLPELPFVTMSPEYGGQIGNTLELKCSVESLVPFSVKWFRNGASKSGTMKYNQTAEVPLHLGSVSQDDAGTYICKATNIAGTSYKETTLKVAGPPPEVTTLRRVLSVAGKPTLLDCNVKSDIEYNVTWDKIVQSSKEGVKRGGISTVKSLERTPRFAILGNNSLEIGPVLTSDEGWYTCTAISKAGRASSKIYLQLSQVPVARVYPRRSDFKAGSSFSIYCTFIAGIPNPTLRFKKNGQLIENSDVYKGVSSIELRISQANREHAGVYTCEAQNDAGEGYDLAELIYSEPPEVTADESTKLVKAGESVFLSCKVTGTPPPTITWLKDGQHIPFGDSSRFKINNTRLEITPVYNVDVGQYNCVAENDFGTAQDFVELQVGTPPRLVQLPTDTIIPIGGSGSILCTAIGLPVPRIIWSKDGQQLDPTRFEISNSGRLYIKGATAEDEGSYTCTVANDFGKEVLFAYIKISGIVTPKLKEGSLPEVTRVLLGDYVQLQCPVVEGNPPPSRTWYKDGNIVDENTIGAYFIVEADGSLVINKIRPEDIGKYECKVRNVGGEDILTTVIQTVVPPSVITDESSPPQQKIILGGEVILQCPVQGDPLPTVYWLRNGNRLPQSSMVGTNLRLAKVVSDNRGDYICVATNPAGSVNRTVTLSVLLPPKITEWNEASEVTEGEEVILQCDVEAWPPAVISWFKDGDKLPFRTKYARFPGNKNSEGRYTCVAVNEVGTDQKHLDLFVSVPPAVSTIPKVKAPVGTDVSLECNVVGDPKPRVYWMKHGIRLHDSLQTGSILRLTNISLNDGGSYECIAVNSAGTVSATTNLDVLLPPKITQWEEQVNAIENQELWLKCVVLKTHPPANISWYKGEERLPYQSRHLRFIANKTSEGRYSCLAENEGGSDRRYLNLFVAVRPKIAVNKDKTSPNIMQPVVGSEVVLQCQIEQGDPFPQVYWLQDGKRLPESKQRGTDLHLTNLTTAESGNYVCTAGNAAGTDSISVSVDVIEPPKIIDWREFVEVTEGSSTKLECQVPISTTGIVNFTWFKEETKLPFNTDSLRLLVRKEDQGRYSCLAENIAGSDHKFVDLFVVVPPEIEQRSPTHVKGIAGESVTIECFVKGDPTPQVSWIRDGVTLPRQNQSVNSLTLVNLTTADSGTYVCSAINSGGSALQATSVTVIVGPKISEWQDDIRVAAGEGVSLNCQVIGDPPITITWFKNGDELPYHGRTLRFAAKAEDSGIYMCRAENEAGTDLQEATVSVLVPAFISPAKEETITVISGAEPEVRFVCGADGIPPPKVTWQKDSKNIVEDIYHSFDEHDLILNEITPNFAGVYTCEAENIAGIAYKTFKFDVYEKPKILDTFPGSVQLKEGDDYSIPCTASGIPKPHLSWKKGNKLLYSGYQDDDSLVMQDNTLVLTSLTTETGGVYSCIAENPAGIASNNYTIEVLVPPVTIDPSVTNIDVIELESGILSCPFQKAIPTPEIQWLKNGHPISELPTSSRSDDSHYNFKENGAVLVINEVGPDDSAIYTCVAKNAAGRSEATFSVNLLLYPYFVDESQDKFITRVQGEELILDCVVNGNPPPKVSWKRVELGLPVTEHTSPGVVVEIPLRRRLMIPSVQKHHAGTYQCTAVNKIGKDSRQFYLNVIAQPELEGPAEESLEVVKGENITLHCRISGSPNPTITWTFTNGDADIQTIKNEGSEQTQLELNNVTSNHGGIYLCTGDNTAGSVSKHFNLSVLEVPQISKSEFQEEVKVTAGDDLVLTCNAVGLPEPVVTWLLNGHVVANATKLDNNSYLLQLKSVHSRSGGKYSCVASNKAGVAEKIFKVKVLVPPKLSKQRWHGGSDTIASVEGLPLTIKCPVIGTPVPDIKWVKNDVPLNTEKEMLHIGTAKKEHSGNYTCIATNHAGNFSKTFLVNVLVPPAFLDEEHAKYIRIMSNSSVHLNCSVKGHPHPTIMWVKGAEPIAIHLSNTTRLSNFNQTLELHAVDVDHSGRYSCLASNLAGAMEKTFDIEVIEPPSMDEGINRNDTITEVEVVLHRKAVLECPLSGAPEPIITWYKEGELFEGPQISLDGRELHIMSSSPKDAGNYSCVAENQAGIKELLFDVKVVVPLEWTEWSEWTQCSASCDGGSEERNRTCGDVKDWNLPGIKFDTSNCEGESFQRRLCSPLPCPVHGHWSEWSSWTSCSETCGRATRRRYRKCDSPAPALGGAPCSGSDAEQEYCFLGLCPVQAQWNEWSEWSKCSRTCDQGVMFRTRRCTRQDNGDETVGCEGRDRESSPCSLRRCPEDGKWSEWGEWSECSVTCGRGNRQRSRTCSRSMFGGKSCIGDNIQIEECRMYGCHKRSIPTLRSAALRVKGNLNGEELEDTYIDADIRNDGPKRVVTATLQDILKQQAGWFPYLAFLLPPVSWSSATENEDANNGYSLTNGSFTEESKFQFATGQELVVTHAGKGIDQNGNLKVEIEVEGNVPLVEPRATIVVKPYTEDYVQTGPNSLFANSRSILDIDGQKIPFTWNKTVSYDSDLGTMPYLVERLSTKPLATEYNPKNQELKFVSSSEISRKYSEDKCPLGFKLDKRHQHCTDINECQESRRACHQTQICENQFGSYKCHCRSGFRMSGNGRRCVDINECKEESPCSHKCLNTRGSYRCLCPSNYVLGDDGVTCQAWEIIEKSDDGYGSDDDYYDGSDYLESRQAREEIACRPGYIWNKSTCVDLDECQTRRHSCHTDQTCINLQGGYNCIDTPCIGDYELDPQSGKCIQQCKKKGIICEDGAEVAQIINYSVLPLSSNVIHPYQDITSMSPQGLEYDLLPRTVFSIIENESGIPLRIRIENGQGILYAMKYFTLQGVHSITIQASSYSKDNQSVLFTTRFVIFIYHPESIQL